MDMGMKPIIEVPRGARVLLLEDSQARIKWFNERIPDIFIANTVGEAITLLASKQFDVFFLDHDLGLLDADGKPGPEGNGAMFAKYLSETGYLGGDTVIHSWNPTGAANMAKSLPNATVIPFGKFEIERT